ncbi:MAG: DUF6483 family protein [Acutalibacteraceae bacterium]
MGFQDDWMLRQIEMIAHFVAKVVFQKDTVEYEVTDELSNTDLLHNKLDKLIKEGKICEAEDMLFDNIEYNDRYVELATDFYRRINAFNDKELENLNFSRDEVYEGFIDILEKLGVPVEQFRE